MRLFLLIIFAFILQSVYPSTAEAAIALDSTANSGTACGTAATSCTIPETSFDLGNGAGNNRMVIVGITTEIQWSGVITSVTIDGTSGTEVVRNRGDNSSTWISNCALYVFTDNQLPGTSGDYTVKANFDITTNDSNINVISLTGVLQGSLDATGYNQGSWPTNSTAITRSATTINDNAWLIDVVHHGNPGTWSVSGDGQTLQTITGPDSSASGMSTKVMTTAGGFVFKWSATSTSNRIGHSWISVLPAPGRLIMISRQYQQAPRILAWMGERRRNWEQQVCLSQDERLALARPPP